MCLDSPYDVVSQNLLVALFGEGKLSTDVLGTEKTIKKITDKKLYDCYNAFYRYSNMALVVSGDVDPCAVLDTVEASLPEREVKKAPVLPSVEVRDGVFKTYIEKQMPVSMPVFEIGIKDVKPSVSAEERLSRDVAMTILDEMLFSRAGALYEELFEGGLINESYSYGYSITRDVAFHSIYAESEDPCAVLERIKEYLRNAKKFGLSERDFIRCKRVMMAEFIRDFDSVDDIANSLLNFKFEGSDIFVYRRIIENVQFSDVCKCFDESFSDESFAISVVKNTI